MAHFAIEMHFREQALHIMGVESLDNQNGTSQSDDSLDGERI